MAVKIRGSYAGGLKVDLVHEPSGATIRTAAPADNNGDGSSFSPSDLVAGALGACMLTIIAIVGERDGISLDGLSFSVEKHMQPDPRRIRALPITIRMPDVPDPKMRAKLERSALTCPVHRSLLEEIEKPVQFVYPD